MEENRPSSITPAFEPSAHHSPGGEHAQRLADVIVVEPVERRRQVGVERPQTLRVSAAGRGVDRHDRIVATPARSQAIRLRLEPGLPLGFLAASPSPRRNPPPADPTPPLRDASPQIRRHAKQIQQPSVAAA